MALFQFGKKEPLARLKGRDWASESEREALIEEGVSGTRDCEALIELLYVDDPSVRRASIRRIKALGASGATIDAFVKVSRDKPGNTVGAIALALTRVLSDDALDRAIRHLDSKDMNSRKAAEAFVLAAPLDRRGLGLAERWLEGGDAHRALKIMESVARGSQEGTADPAAVKALVERALDHPDEQVRQVAWQVMAERGQPEDLPIFIDAVGRETYSNQKLLAEAIGELARRGSAEVTDTILPLLGSTNAVLRTTAVNVLRRLRDPDAVIRRFVAASRTMAPMVRERALQTLGELGERLIEPLLGLMDDEDPEVAMLAITMASTLGEDRRMARPLIKALGAREWWVQATAAETLGTLGEPAAVEPLAALLKDADTVWTAIGALATTAITMHARGDTSQSLQALGPLMIMLKAGQRGSQVKQDEEAADLRLEIINGLRPLATERILGILRKVAQDDSDPRVRAEALSTASAMAKALGTGLEGERELREGLRASGPEVALRGINAWLSRARKEGASDLHVAAEQQVMIRRTGRLSPLDGDKILPAEAAARLIRDLLTDEQAAIVARTGQLNLSYTVEGAGRFRANIFSDYHGLNAVFRVIPDDLPTIQSIGLPPRLADVQYWHQGLLLVCGASGSGKTTTLTALINLINETRESHIVTIEDPIEYVHASRRSLVNQRELSTHTRSYARALRGALRQDPDVIVVGEMNDAETVALAMEASETGHLVIGTLNCVRAETAIDRVVGSFSQDEQNQVRLALSESLKAVVAQRLVPTADGASMAAAFEVIMVTSQVSSLIREGKTTMIQSAMQTGQAHGMQTFDDALVNLVRAGRITADAAMARASDKKLFEDVAGNPAEA